MYSDVVDALSVYCVGCEGGVCSSGDVARDILGKVGKIDAEISRLRAEMKREDQFNRQMELHVQMMELKRRRERVLKEDVDD